MVLSKFIRSEFFALCLCASFLFIPDESIAAGVTCPEACTQTVTCTGSTTDNSWTDPYDGTPHPQFDTTWNCSNGETISSSNNTGANHTGATFSFCDDKNIAWCMHRNQVATMGGPVVEYSVCQAKSGYEFFGYNPNWQQFVTTPDGDVVRNFSYTLTQTSKLDLFQFQGEEALTVYRDEMPSNVTYGYGQNPFPTGVSGSCQPSLTCSACKAATCTYVNTTRVDANHEYSTYNCDNGGTYNTPVYEYTGVPPYPASRWYYAGTTIRVRANETIGGDANCSPLPGCGSAINGTCGTAHGTPTTTAPSTGLCNAGVESAVTGTGP